MVDAFSIRGSDGYITIVFQEVFNFPEKTSVLGGYDVRGVIEIQCGTLGQYQAKGTLYFSTGQLFNLYNQLKDAYKSLHGEINFTNEYDKTLNVKLEFDDKGHCIVSGDFGELSHERKRLFFEINSDQTYFSSTIKELHSIVDKYGDLKGIRLQNNGCK